MPILWVGFWLSITVPLKVVIHFSIMTYSPSDAQSSRCCTLVCSGSTDRKTIKLLDLSWKLSKKGTHNKELSFSVENFTIFLFNSLYKNSKIQKFSKKNDFNLTNSKMIRSKRKDLRIEIELLRARLSIFI